MSCLIEDIRAVKLAVRRHLGRSRPQFSVSHTHSAMGWLLVGKCAFQNLEPFQSDFLHFRITYRDASRSGPAHVGNSMLTAGRRLWEGINFSRLGLANWRLS
jgi:hypothetical protein